MREHHALRFTGSARGIDKRGQILRLDRKAAQPLLHIDSGCASAGIFQQRGEGDHGERALQARDLVHDEDALELRLVRMEATFRYCASVDTTAIRAPESISRPAICSAVRVG